MNEHSVDNDNLDDNKLVLNRSSSFSDSPVSQQIRVEQFFGNQRGETLIRQYSCEQIYDRSNKNQTIHYKESVYLQSPSRLGSSSSSLLINSYKSSAAEPTNFKFQANSNRLSALSHIRNSLNFHDTYPKERNFEKPIRTKIQESWECTPMEVDTNSEDHPVSGDHLSSKLEDKELINLNDERDTNSLESKVDMKKKELINERDLRVTSSKLFVKFFIIILIPVICSFILLNTDFYIRNISDTVEAQNITNALQDLLYGQEEVVRQVNESLNNIENNHLLVFTGGIGVGKTYSASIISKYFQSKTRISFAECKNSYCDINPFKTLSALGYSLVIVDDLEIDDKQSVIPFVKKIFDSGKKILMILIYTISEVSLGRFEELNLIASSTGISDALSRSDLNHSLIIFQKLKVDVIRKCISYAMTKKGLMVNQNNIEKVLKSIDYEYSGCKGVFTKVALLK